jgi:hypothetical protein
MAPDFDVVGGARPNWHRWMREVGERQKQSPALLLDFGRLDLELLYQPAPFPVLLEDVAYVLAGLLRPGHLFAGAVLLPLELLELGYQTTTLRLELCQLLEVGFHVGPPVLQGGSYFFQSIADKRRFEHR